MERGKGGSVERRLLQSAQDRDELDTRVALSRALSTQFGKDEAVRVGRYKLRQRLGAGGMGEVWAAEDPALDRRVAIKLFAPGFSPLHEARALARLQHPGVVEVFEVGEHDGRVFMVMELLEGGTLREWLSKQRPWVAVLEAVRGIGRALAAAHAVGLVHRDVKPSNVMLTAKGDVKLIDFGIAVQADDAAKTTSLTGTLTCTAPEQLRGLRATPATDQFALCLLACEALSGRPAFASGGVELRLQSIATGAAGESPPGVPPRVWRALRRGLALDPADRWPDIDALLRALFPAARTRHVVLAVAAAAMVGGIALFGADTRSCEDRAGARVHTAVGNDANLREYGERWRATYVEVCHEPADPAFDTVMKCLDEGLQAAAALRELVEQDRVRTDAATQAAARLTSPTVCTESDRATRDSCELPECEQARRGYAQARALILAGERDAAAPLLDSLVDDVAALDAPRLAADINLAAGATRLEVLDFSTATERFEAALAYAERSVHVRVVIRAAALLMRVHTVHLGDAPRGDYYRRYAQIAIERYGEPAQVRGMFDNELAQVLGARGDFEAAIDHQRRAYAAARERSPHDGMQMQGNLSVLLSRAGQHDEAIEHARGAMAGRRELLGAGHSALVLAAANGGAVEAAGGELRAAQRTFEAGLALSDRAYGTGHPYTAMLLHNLGCLALDQGEPQLAIERLRRALAVREALRPPGHPLRVETQTALALAHRRAGALDRAAETLHALAGDLESAVPVEPDALTRTLVELASVQLEVNDPAAARSALDRLDPWLEDEHVPEALAQRVAEVQRVRDELQRLDRLAAETQTP